MFCGGSYIHTTVGNIGYILPATLVSRSAPTNTTSSSATQMARPQPVGCSESQLSWWSNPWARALLFIWGQNLPGSRDSLRLQRPWQLMVGERQLKNTWLELSEVCIHLWLPVVHSRLTFRLLACWILNTGEIVMFLRRRDMKNHEKLDTPKTGEFLAAMGTGHCLGLVGSWRCDGGPYGGYYTITPGYANDWTPETNRDSILLCTVARLANKLSRSCSKIPVDRFILSIWRLW